MQMGYYNLYDGQGIVEKELTIGEEITLVTFCNKGNCVGALELISETAPLISVVDSFIRNQHQPYCGGIRPENDLSTYDSLSKAIYNVSDVFDIGQAICSIKNPDLSTSTENLKLKNNLKAWPNSFNYQLLIQFDNPINKNYELVINDLSGRVIQRIKNLTDNQVIVQRQDMPVGMYIAQLCDENGNFATTKVIVE